MGSSKFEYTVEAEEFTMRVLGGSRKQAVAVFVFSESEKCAVLKQACQSLTEPRTSSGIMGFGIVSRG